MDSRTIRIPADDGTIAHALAALDVKLADWADALRAAEHIIADAVKTGPPSGNDPSPHPATPDGPALEAPPRAAEGQAADLPAGSGSISTRCLIYCICNSRVV